MPKTTGRTHWSAVGALWFWAMWCELYSQALLPVYRRVHFVVRVRHWRTVSLSLASVAPQSR